MSPEREILRWFVGAMIRISLLLGAILVVAGVCEWRGVVPNDWLMAAGIICLAKPAWHASEWCLKHLEAIVN